MKPTESEMEMRKIYASYLPLLLGKSLAMDSIKCGLTTRRQADAKVTFTVAAVERPIFLGRKKGASLLAIPNQVRHNTNFNYMRLFP